MTNDNPKVGAAVFTASIKKGRGRPAFKPTDEMRCAVAVLAAAGTRHDLIGRAFNTTVKTLKKHFPKELREGLQIIGAAVGKRLIEKALAGDLTSIIWFEKTRMGFHEKMDLAHGVNGAPVESPFSGLRISFEDGAPGRPSTIEVGNAQGVPYLETVTAQEGAHPAIEPVEASSPPLRQIAAPKPAAELWARLGMDTEAFNKLPKQELITAAEADAALRFQAHEHHASLDALCRECRRLAML